MAFQETAKSPFKAFIGIDFGTDGSGIAYALPNGEAFIHNMWDNTDATRKPKTSVLLSKDGDVVCVGSDAQDMYLKAKNDIGYKLFERFKMNLYEEPSNKEELKSAETKMDYVELKQEISATHDTTVKESSSKIFIAQLQYLKDQAFKFISQHLTKKVKGLQGDAKTGYPEIQFFLTVPAIWSDRAKGQMVEWAITAGLISGKVANQLKIVYEPDCASLSIQHAIMRALNAGQDQNDEDDKNKKKKKKKKNKLRSLIPKISLNVPFNKGDKYILLDVGGGTCDVACHRVMGNFSIAEVLQPSGGKWGATYIDERFMELLSKLFGKDLMNIYQMAESDGRQSYLKFLQYFLNEAKLSYYANYDTDKDIPHYHDIQIPGNFVNFIVTQYLAQKRNESSAGDGEMQKGLDELNVDMKQKSADYKRKEKKQEQPGAAPAANAANPVNNAANPVHDVEGYMSGEEEDDEDVNERFQDRDWMAKIIEADDEEDDVEEDYMLSLHNDVWRYLFDANIKPIIEHCEKILNKPEMKDTKYIFLVGGFANSKYFQMRMTEAFSKYKNLQIVTPGLPGLCVVDGAARYGLTTSFVKIRKVPKTYGIAVTERLAAMDANKKYPTGFIAANKYFDKEENTNFVKNCFSAFVQKGQEIKLNDKPVTREYGKPSKNAKSVTIRIYSSTKENPLTVAESTSHKLASVSVPMPKHVKDVTVEFSFGDTLITVFTYPSGQPQKRKQVKVDYHAPEMKEVAVAGSFID